MKISFDSLISFAKRFFHLDKDIIKLLSDKDLIINKLTDIGFEVENVTNKYNDYDNFTIAQIVKLKKIENSKLSLCDVRITPSAVNNNDISALIDSNSSANSIINVVCGADNVKDDLYVIYAKIGSIIPNGNFKIKKSKIRGNYSYGMLCSLDELNLSKKDFKKDAIIDRCDGIAEIQSEFLQRNNINIGDNLSSILDSSPILDINITPNRGDALSIYGILRDLLAALKINYDKDLINNYKFNHQSNIANDIDIINNISSDLKNYKYFKITNINNSYLDNNNINNSDEIPNSSEINNFLKNINCNRINPLVDIGNYLMYNFGYPIHIYDLDKIKDFYKNNKLHISYAKKGQKFLTLKEENLLLEDNDLIMTDENHNILCLLAIIGGKDTQITHDSKNILIEIADFNQKNIILTNRRLRIDSESCHRFERYVDNDIMDFSLNYFISLVKKNISNNLQFSDIKITDNYKKQEKKIILDISKINHILSIDINLQDILSILDNLAIKYNKIDNNQYKLIIPNFRNDLNSIEDITEEIGRIYGYNNIKSQKINIVNSNDHNYKQIDYIEQIRLFLSKNLNEVITYPFMPQDMLDFFSQNNRDPILIENPILKDSSYLSNYLTVNLLKNIKENYKDKDKIKNNFAIFEINKIFFANNLQNGDIEERLFLASLITGYNSNKDIYKLRREFDLFDIKKYIFDIFNLFNINNNSIRYINSNYAFYHPYRQISLFIGKNEIAKFGQIHPSLLNNIKIKTDILSFEIDLQNLQKVISSKKLTKKYIPNNLPIVNRDFSFIFKNNITFNDIKKSIIDSQKEYKIDINFFDKYKIDNETQSIAFNINIHPNDKTFTSNELDIISDKIISNLSNNLQAILRSK